MEGSTIYNGENAYNIGSNVNTNSSLVDDNYASLG